MLRDILRRHCLTFLLPALLVPAGLEAADNPLADRVKAAYLFNLILFVDWPSLPPDDITLCVAGSDSIGSALEELGNRRVKDRGLRIRTDATDYSTCQLLYIGDQEANWRDLLRESGPGVLSVSDHEGFVRAGGIVGFYMEAGKVRLEVSQGAADQAGLRISSRVLELARVLP